MAIIVEIKVVPQSGKNSCILDKQGRLTWYLKSPPEKGLANSELVKSIAQKLKVAQSLVEIVSGHTGRKKRVALDLPISYEQFLQKLGIEQQKVIF